MKKLILSAAMVAATLAFGQKKEINAAFKAIESGDIATASAQATAAEAALAAKPVSPDLMEKFYYAKGLALIKSGKIAEGAGVLAKINELKNDKFSPSLTGKIGNEINPLLQKSSTEAQAAYDAKNYATAASKFREVYDLLKAAGQENKQYLYYTAITYAQANNSAKAIDTYNELINSGYTGVETTYIAKDKKTGKPVQLDKASWELYKKAGAAADYTDFKTETSKSVEQELYETNAALLLEAKRYDEALAVIEKGQKKFPNSARLSELQGSAYFNSGKTDQFVQSLKAQVAKNPTDKTAWYNLGVLASKDPAKKSEAEAYFKKALEIDPNYVPALQGIWYNVYLGDDDAVIKKAKEAQAAKKTDVFNKIMEERRGRFAKGIPFVEKWYSLEPNNLEVVSLLKNLYQSTHNDVKFQEFKAKEAALNKK